MEAKEFLLKEYDHFANSIHQNETIGETRVHFFIGLTTAVLSAVVALNIYDDDPRSYSSLILLINLLFGIITQIRIIWRNRATEKFKHQLHRARKALRDLYEVSEKTYPSFTIKPNEKWPFVGGLNESIAFFNSFILFLILMILFPDINREFYEAVVFLLFIVMTALFFGDK